jgi:hypothetical protein
MVYNTELLGFRKSVEQLFLLHIFWLSAVGLPWSQVIKQLCESNRGCPLIEISSVYGTQLSRCLLPPHLRTAKRRVF